MSNKAQEFLEKVWKTRGARFNAYRRLRQRHWLSVLTTSLLSVYVATLTLLPAMIDSASLPLPPQALRATTTLLAAMILVVGLVEHFKSYELHADRLHRSGLRLGELYDQLEGQLESEDVTAAVMDGQEKYHSILREIDDNHEPCDYRLFKAQHRQHFEWSRWKAAATIAVERLRTGIWYWVAIIVPPLLVLAVAR